METFAEISLKNIRHNVNRLKELDKNCELMAVLKADGYGHGAIKVAETLLKENVKNFAVANVFEALEIKDSFRESEVLVFGFISPENLHLALANDICISIFSIEYWESIKHIVNKHTKVHIKINTGFNRLGFDINDSYKEATIDIIKQIYEKTNVLGIYSHLALENEEEDLIQFNKFESFVSELEAMSMIFKFKHIADSIGFVKYSWARLSMARIGAALYGLRTPFKGYDSLNLKGALKLFATVSQVRNIKKGEGVSYDNVFIAPTDLKIATVTIGYADGIFRNLWGKWEVLVNGKKALIIGIMCMDQMMIDVTNIENVNQGDKVLVYEIEDSSLVSVHKMAPVALTNKNEIIASLSKRVRRVYTD